MYEKPSLQRFGTFRDLTRAGLTAGTGDPSSSWAFTEPQMS